MPGQSHAVLVPQAPARKAGEAKKSERKIEHEFKQAIREAEKANICQQEPASAAKQGYEKVTTLGRAAEPSLAVGGAEATDIEELRPGYIPLHARVREESARIREQQEKDRPITRLGRPLPVHASSGLSALVQSPPCRPHLRSDSIDNDPSSDP